MSKTVQEPVVRVTVHTDGALEFVRNNDNSVTIYPDEDAELHAGLPLVKTPLCLQTLQSKRLAGRYAVRLSAARAMGWKDVEFREPTHFKFGDTVAYATKDTHGYQGVVAKFQRYDPKGDHAHIETVESKVVLLVPACALTKVKVVWMDTFNLVSSEN